MNKLVYGWGVNDADYKVEVKKTSLSDGKIAVNRLFICPIYRTWKEVLRRCLSDSHKQNHPTYLGVSACEEWRMFSAFRAWMVQQDYAGKHIDKDLLVKGNRVYSPDLCVFIPQALNNFIGVRSDRRGIWPLGVNFDSSNGMLRAQCSNPFTGKKENLGLFHDPDEAHEAWRKRKHELACVYAEQQTDPRIAQALRERYSKGVEQ